MIIGSGATWPLLVLAGQGGELGELSRDVARALDELAQTTSEFSCGSARSSVAVSVISDNMQRLRDQLDREKANATKKP